MKTTYTSPRSVSLRLHTEGMMAASAINEVSHQKQLSDEREDGSWNSDIWGGMEEE